MKTWTPHLTTHRIKFHSNEIKQQKKRWKKKKTKISVPKCLSCIAAFKRKVGDTHKQNWKNIPNVLSLPLYLMRVTMWKTLDEKWCWKRTLFFSDIQFKQMSGPLKFWSWEHTFFGKPYMRTYKNIYLVILNFKMNEVGWKLHKINNTTGADPGFWNGGWIFSTSIREIKYHFNIWGITKKKRKGAQKKGGENSPISPPLDLRLHQCQSCLHHLGQ